jgi:Voltage-dependent anion channel
MKRRMTLASVRVAVTATVSSTAAKCLKWPLAMSILTLLVLRLALHKLPERDMGASAWLALGPIGTGALGLVLLGGEAPAIFAANGLRSVGDTAFGLGVIGGTACGVMGRGGSRSRC